jgi:23S rRNA (adenine2503-C2)-methyltransferase
MSELTNPEPTEHNTLLQPVRQPLSLYDFTFDQLAKQLAEMGEPSFRAKQIWQWMYQRMAGSIDEMSDLPKPLRAKLNDKFVLNRITPVTEAQSSDGWTRKWLLRFPDGSEIETVLMEYDGVRRTACIRRHMPNGKRQTLMANLTTVTA